MKKWPRLSDIFLLHPTHQGEEGSASFFSNQHLQWQKIRFDNTVRIWIAVPSYLACYLLKSYGAVASILPMTIVFTVYGALQFLATWTFMDSKHWRKMDYLLAFFDAVAMSLSVFYTGGTDSPLYFVYFIPLVVHAFHRDWGLLMFSGFGGVSLYAFVISHSIPNLSPALTINLGARMFFMLLTVSVACLALSVLRKQDDVDQGRIRRLKNLTLVSESLNRMTTMSERSGMGLRLIDLVNEGLGASLQPWTRFLFVQKDGALLKALASENNQRTDLSQEIPTLTCPVMKNNTAFVLEDSSKGSECPTEKFSFGSHVCLPVSGAENEIFGVLFVGSPFPNIFRKEEMQFLEFVAKSLGLTIQRLNRMEELRKSLEMNSWVMAATIASSRSAFDTYGAVLDGVMAILRADAAQLWVHQSTSEMLKLVETRGTKLPEDRALQLPLKTLKGEDLGVIKAVRLDPTEKFSAIEVETIATFAMRAALAIENALAHEVQRERIHLFLEDPQRKKAA